MALLTDWAGDYDLPPDLLKGAVAISGLFDLGFLPYSYVQPKVQATWDQVDRLSPLRHLPRQAPPLVVAVGERGDRRVPPPVARLPRRLAGAGLRGSYLEPAGKNHFTVLEELETPRSELHSAGRAHAGSASPPQWMSSASAIAARSFSTLNPAWRAAAMTGASRRVHRSMAPGTLGEAASAG